METKEKDLFDTAVAAGHFAIFSNALKAAGMVGTFKGVGPFTFFAPTDEAFRKLPAGTMDGLLKDKEKLIPFINYHILPGILMAKDLKAGESKTRSGAWLTIAANDEGLTVDGAKVTKKDLESTNGVIHAIDTVIHAKQ